MVVETYIFWYYDKYLVKCYHQTKWLHIGSKDLDLESYVIECIKINGVKLSQTWGMSGVLDKTKITVSYSLLHLKSWLSYQKRQS